MDQATIRLECLKLVLNRGQGPAEILLEADVYEKFVLGGPAAVASPKALEVKADKKAITIGGKKSGNSDILT